MTTLSNEGGGGGGGLLSGYENRARCDCSAHRNVTCVSVHGDWGGGGGS
jgi:hypothetical protein